MASTDDGLVRPSESRRPTKEEYEKSGGLKEGSTLVLEIIDDSRNCLLGRETIKVEPNPSRSDSTKLKLRVVKREEFFTDDVDIGDIPVPVSDGGKAKLPVPVPGSGKPKLDPELIFEAIKWGYDVIKNSSHLSTADNEATAVIKGTTWSDYYNSKDSNSGVVTFRTVDWLTRWELASFKARTICRHRALPINQSRIPNGWYLGNVRGECTSAWTAPGMSLNGTCEILDKVNDSNDANIITPSMTVKFKITVTALAIENSTVTGNFKVHGYRPTRWLGWNN